MCFIIMNKDKWSPYITAIEGSPKIKQIYKNEVYELAKERKNITERLHLMRVRIKQLEKEEFKAKNKAIKAEQLADSIIDRRVEHKKKELEKEQIKKRREQELNDLKDRNREMKEYIRSEIAHKKEQVIKNKKNIAKMVKEANEQRKNETPKKSIKTASTSPRLVGSNGKSEFSKLSQSRIEEEKEKVNDAVKEIKKLEELELALINKLKDAYEIQKSSENKVAFLINHPVIVTKEDLKNNLTLLKR